MSTANTMNTKNTTNTVPPPTSPKRKWINVYISSIAGHPLVGIAIIAVVTVLLAWHLPGLAFKTTVYDLMVEDIPETKQYRDFRALFGSDELIRLVIRAGDVFEPTTFAKVTQISEAAARIPGVRRVLSLPEIKKSVDTGNKWSTSQFADLLAPVTLLKRNLMSHDHRTTIITLVLADTADKTVIIRAVEGLILKEGPHLLLYQTGMPQVSQALAQFTQADFFHLVPLSLLVIAFLLVILFRNLHCILLPLGCVGLTIIWTFGFMAWIGMPVSMLTTIVPVFLIAVGTAYCLHICSEYLVQSRHCAAEVDRVGETFRRMSLPVILAIMTTMIGIGSLAVNPIWAIQEFALVTFCGLFSLLIIALIFIPAVLTLLPMSERVAKRRRWIDLWIDALLQRIVNLNLRHQKAVLGAIFGLVAICILGIFFLRVETNPVAFFKSDTPVSRHFYDITTDMSGSFPINVTVAAPMEDYFEDPARLDDIVRLQEFLDQIPGVDKSISLVDYLKLINYVVHDYNAEFHALPQDAYEMRYLLNNFKMLLGSDLLQRFLSPDYQQLNILLLTHLASSRVFLETRSAILDRAESLLDGPLGVEVTGLGMVIAASSDLLTSGQIKSLSISLVLIFVVMVALFLSTKVGFIALLTNCFPIIVNFGLMGLLGIPLSVATCLIASVAIGLAVDDTIHYLVRYNTEFKKDLDKDRAMRDTVTHVGRPILITSFTIGLGFAMLAFSNFQPTAVFGFLMVVTMIAALIGDLVLLPTLMMHVELVTAWDLLKTIPTVGRISAGMVHELNQPLNAIKVGSDFLKMMAKRETPLTTRQLTAVSQQIGDQVARASDMIHRFSEAALVGDTEPGPLPISTPIHEALGILANQIKLDNIGISLDLPQALPPIAAHHGRMVQVFCHLIQNAWEAMVKKKTPGPDPMTHCLAIQAREVEGYLEVKVIDTGIGMSRHQVERVFEPFFTTKAQGQGRGLGLTVVKQILRELGGRIRIHSQLGRGTTITLSLPVVDS